ncbi:unnamed protein product [Mortierella alpina]
MADDKQKHLVFSILEFLQASLDNGTIKPDDSEGVEVAIQCIGEAFGVDLNDAVQAQTYSTKPATLVSILMCLSMPRRSSETRTLLLHLLLLLQHLLPNRPPFLRSPLTRKRRMLRSLRLQATAR